MASVRKKREIVNEKETMMVLPSVEPYEIVNIVNAVWPESFGRVSTNKYAIAELGWLPFNRNLMTYSIVRAIITKEEIEKEESDDSDVLVPYHKKSGRK